MLPIFRKNVTQLFYEQEKFKEYMNSMVTIDQNVQTPFTLYEHITYDRLYDEWETDIILSGKHTYGNEHTGN